MESGMWIVEKGESSLLEDRVEEVKSVSDISLASLICVTSSVWPFTSQWHRHTYCLLLNCWLFSYHTYSCIRSVTIMQQTNSSFTAMKGIAYNLFSISFFFLSSADLPFLIFIAQSAFYFSGIFSMSAKPVALNWWANNKMKIIQFHLHRIFEIITIHQDDPCHICI